MRLTGWLVGLILAGCALAPASARVLTFQHGDHHYVVVTTDMTWPEAATLCAKHGGYLVSIENSEENDFVRKCYASGGVEFGWLGLRTDNDGKMIWADGQAVGFKRFGPGEGIGEARKYYNMNVRTGDWMGSNYLFQAKRPFICESNKPMSLDGWETAPDDPTVPPVTPSSEKTESRGGVPTSSGSSETTTTHPPKPEPSAAPEKIVDEQELRSLVQHAIGSVETRGVNQGVLFGTPAVAVGKDNLLVASARVLVQSRDGRLNLGGNFLPLEVVRVDPVTGLALFRVERKQGGDAPQTPVSGLEIGEARQGQRVWIVTRDDAGKVALVQTRVAEVHAAPGSQSVAIWTLSRATRWAEAGCPVINEDGQLVGVAWPTSPGGAETRIDALGSSGVAALLGGDTSGKTSYASAAKAAEDAAGPYLPQEAGIAAKATARQVRWDALGVEKRLLCDGCKGEGKVVRSVHVGKVVVAGVGHEKWEDREFVCKVCSGTGLQEPKRLYRDVTDMTDELVHLNMKDDNADKAIDAVKTCFDPLMGDAHWAAFAEAIEAQGNDAMFGRNARLGAAVAGVGTPGDVGKRFGLDPAKYILVNIRGDRAVLLATPRINRPAKGEAIFGGVLLGWLHDPSTGEDVPVVADGYLIGR